MTNEVKPAAARDETWTDLERVFDVLGRTVYETFGLWPFGGYWTGTVPAPRPALRAARTDVTDTGASFKIVADVPGVPKDALEIQVKGLSVEIRGEVTHEKEEKAKGEVVHRERTHVGFYRALELPEPVVATEAKAKVENGVLELELPKQRPTPPETGVKVAVH